ncbi:hypothetical protein [Burkholderia oklahomensis]|uniref:hypothetical protein n=1 Tax=Burkholderia oklahomensis TaxID=342113 RepID=UPI000A8791CE|nr:hypothetical protein [Burkholderia oklahomensis]
MYFPWKIHFVLNGLYARKADDANFFANAPKRVAPRPADICGSSGEVRSITRVVRKIARKLWRDFQISFAHLRVVDRSPGIVTGQIRFVTTLSNCCRAGGLASTSYACGRILPGAHEGASHAVRRCAEMQRQRI